MAMVLCLSLTAAWAAQALYMHIVVDGAPNAWFIIYTPIAANSYAFDGYTPKIISKAYRSQGLCEDALLSFPKGESVGCQKLRLDYAAKMGISQ